MAPLPSSTLRPPRPSALRLQIAAASPAPSVSQVLPRAMLRRMRIGLVVTGGVDRSGRERVVPTLLWLIERLARRHEVHVFALHYYRDPCTYPLAGALVHDVGRVDGPPGLRLFRLRRRLDAAIRRA